MTFSDLVKIRTTEPELIKKTPYLAKWAGGGAIWAKVTTTYDLYKRPVKTSTYHVGYLVKITRPDKVNIDFEALLVYNGKSFNLICCGIHDKFNKVLKLEGMSIQKFLKLVKLQNPNVSFTTRRWDKPYLRKIEKCINNYINGESSRLTFDWDVK